MIRKKQIIPILTIAGSDSCGGAGIQADLKTISSLGLFACSCITAVTAQNTLGVREIFPLKKSLIRNQIDAILEDLPVKAIKIGMLFDCEIIKEVSETLRHHKFQGSIVLDPVMIATSGSNLLLDSAKQAMIEHLFPLVDIITPNLFEACTLTGVESINNLSQQREVAALIQEKLKTKRVLIKGGHFQEEYCTDILLDSDKNFYEYQSKRIDSQNTHGTGCSLSSALACYLALGYDYKTSVQRAKEYVYSAIEHSKDIFSGKGNGSLNHFFNPQKQIFDETNCE
ncbi:MAG: bifunctional hydroxymethylpyrimidine kinase/phosphomethylpyrimidine kinase [Bacteroidales bacterium]|nr:bifunctional hydroxymethylpyrimidine kinase/phosphomethylpyrimidine kinase [Bacteroidales bacterium]